MNNFNDFEKIKQAIIRKATQGIADIDSLDGGLHIPAAWKAQIAVNQMRPKQILGLYKQHKEELQCYL